MSNKYFTPKRVLHCFNENAEFDLNLYFMHCREKWRKMNKTDNVIDYCIEKCTKESIDKVKSKRFRSCLKASLKYRDHDGILRKFTPTISA